MINCERLYKPESFADRLNQKNFLNLNLKFKIIDNGTILPHKDVPGTSSPGFGGIVDEGGNYLEESFVHHGIKTVYTPTEKVDYIPTTVIYFGMCPLVWGHCITDNIKRAWFFKSDIYKNYFKNTPIIYLPMWNGNWQNFFKLLDILEIPHDKLIPIKKPTKFRCIILPDESFFRENDVIHYTSEFEETIDRVRNFALKNFKTLNQKKFYFFNGRNQIGEERVADYFTSKGYAVVHPEKLSLEEQLNIYANCQNFASPLGSVAHNTLFARNNIETIFIPRLPINGAGYNPHQLAIDYMRNLNSNYVDSTISVYLRNFMGPYCYIISKQLKEIFGDKFNGYTEDDMKAFLSYVRYSLSNNFKIDSEAQEYYNNVFQEMMYQIGTRKDLLSQFGISYK